MAKKMLIFVAILAGALFGYTQYQQAQVIQVQKKIETDIQKDRVEMIDKLNKQAQQKVDIKRGTL